MTTPLRILLPLLALLGGALGTPLSGLPQDVDTSKEKTGIAEEQDLLFRQLQRLHGTMENLHKRLVAEGRTHTAELLEKGLEELEARLTEGDEQDGEGGTLQERMERTRAAIHEGMLVYSIDQQNKIIARLERLLDILQDRENLDALEERIEELRELQEALGGLADRESKLREETEKLREEASNEEQRNLEAELSEMIARERELLAQNESLGRESGTMELENLERELAALIAAQRTDRQVLAAWNPDDAATIAAAEAALEEARRAEARGTRLRDAAESLRAAARALRSENPDALREEMEEMLRDAADRARRHARITKDDAAERAAAGFNAAERAFGDQEMSDDERAAVLETEADELAAAGEGERDPAQAARQRAEEALAGLSEEQDAARASTEPIRRLLEEARRGEEAGDAERAQDATEAAARAMTRARTGFEMLGEALSASQSQLSERAARLERGLETMPAGQSEAGKAATEALREAREAMAEASEAARNEQAAEAATAAQEAQEALERAQQQLQATREEAMGSAAEQTRSLAAQQNEAASQTRGMSGKTAQGSMSPQAQEAVEQALEEAAQSMEQATEELSEGRSASAAGSQRDALDRLQEALREAREGVTPSSPEDQARAEELAQEQERIREEMLDLARRIEERENAAPTPSMDRAQEAAQEASEALSQNDLSEAEDREEEAEQELRRTQDQLEEEEEQYQRLRQEEALFRIAEEVRALAEGHLEQMRQLAELDAERPERSDPTRAQKLRLRRISRDEGAHASRAGEIAEAIEAEQALVTAQLMRDIQDDMERIARDISQEGGFQTGDRVQARGRDVLENLEWLAEALRQEQQRRQQDQQQQQQQQQQQNQPPPLVPDATELKLLRRMEIDLQESVRELRSLYPELKEAAAADEMVLEDITRLAVRHERITALFQAMRERLGLEAPAGSGEGD